MLPRISRRWRPAKSLRRHDYVHSTVAPGRVAAVTRYGRQSVGLELRLDSGTSLYASHPAERDLDVSRDHWWTRLTSALRRTYT